MLEQWVIYNSPADYPQQFVARRWEIRGDKAAPTSEMFVADSLSEVRALLPGGLLCMPRVTHDDACIVEVWL